MNIFLNLKSIIKFEQLTSKSFNEINYQSDDIYKLLYCIVISNNPESFLYEDFLMLMNNKKLAKEVTDKFQLILKLIEQFTTKKEPVELPIETDEKPLIKEVLYIKDIVSTLIVHAGMDVNYIMNEMQLTDIEMYMNAYNDKLKQQLENDRLWTYLTILPHVDGKKLNTPAMLYAFPWDAKIEVKPDINNIEFEEFEEIMKKQTEIINKLNKKI